MAAHNAVIASISKIRGLDFTSRTEIVSAAVLPHGSSSTKFLSSLFDDAVNAASHHGTQEELDLIETYAALCLATLSHCQVSTSILHQFLDSFFLPILSLPLFTSSFYTQVSNDLLSLIVSKGQDLCQILLNRCSDSLLSLLETRAQQTNTQSILPLHTCCCLIPGLIAAGGGAVEVLFPLSLHLLMSTDDSIASASLKNIIAPILTHYRSVNDMSAIEAMKNKLVSRCIDMMQRQGACRRNALTALVQLPPSFDPPRLMNEGCPTEERPLTDIKRDFYEELIGVLSSKDDSLDRKRGLYILQQILGPALSSPPWTAWMSIFSILEEFAVHLIKPLWAIQIDKLHSPTIALHQPDEQRGKLKIGLNGRVEKLKGKAKGVGNVVEENTSHRPLLRLPMSWQCIIWTRAFSHPNILMRRLSLRTFLNRSWLSLCVMSEVPLSFVTGALLPTLLAEDMHYSPSSADDEYAGGAQASSCDIQALASSWLSFWLSVKSPGDQRVAVECFLSMNISSRDTPRSCLLPAWTIFSRALLAAKELDLSSCDDGFAMRMIFSLKACRTTLSLPYGLELKRELMLCLLQAAAVICPMKAFSDASATGPLDLIIDLPSSWISPHGHLNDICKRWLSSGEQRDPLLRPNLTALIGNLDAQHCSVERKEADRDSATKLASCLLVLAEDPSPVISSAMHMCIARAMDEVASLHQRSYLSDNFIDRSLLLHLSLIKAAHCSPPSSSFYQSLSAGLSRIEGDLGLNLLHMIESVWSIEANVDSDVEKLAKLTSRLKLMVHSSCLTKRMISSPNLTKAFLQLLSNISGSSPYFCGSSLLCAADMNHLMISIFDSAALASSCLKKTDPSVTIKINALLTTVLKTCKSLEDCGEKEANHKSITTHGLALNETRKSRAGLSSSKWSLMDSLLSFPSNRLSSDLCSQIITEGLDALQSCHSESSVINVLRSIRACFTQTLMSSEDRRAMLALQQGSLSDLAADDSTILVELLRLVLRPVCSSLFGIIRKKVPLIICYLSLLLMPCVFSLGGLQIPKEKEKETLELVHAEGGPVHFVVTRLLEWGKASPRVMLLISSHLAALIELSPLTLIHHLPHVKTLLLSSSNHKGEGGDLDLSDAMGPGVEAEEVTSSLVPDLAPSRSIMAAHLGTDVAPRAAIAFCLHNVAMSCKAKASSLPHRPQPMVTEAEGQGKKKKPKERPVIMFHQEGNDHDDWEKEEEAVANEEPALVIKEAKEVKSYAEVAASGLRLFKDLMNTALYDEVISNDNVKQGSEIHRKKVRIWQGIGVTSCFLTLTASPLEKTREVAVAMIAKCFSPVSPPSVKQYAEGVLAGMLLNHPALIDELLLPAIESYELNHSGVGSLILIAGQVLMHINDKALQETLIPRLILAMSPWLMSHSHSIRSLAQMITWAVLQRFPLGSDLWRHSQGDLTYLSSVICFMDKNPDLIRLRKGIGEESILPWSPLDLSHPSRLYTNNISLAGTGSRHTVSNTSKEWSSFEGCPQSVIDIIGAYLVLERHRLRDNIWEREREREEGVEVQGLSTLPGASDFQRKISPQDIGISHDNMSSLIQSGLEEALIKARASDARQGDEVEEGEEEEGDNAADGSAAPLQHYLQRAVGEAAGQEIIMCATLVDKIPNLAGLARTCEIFKASCLCIPNSSSAQDPLFSSISVTAERWIPIIQVTEVQLMPFLIKKQTVEGYSIIGLEQSSESVMLPEFKFPKKCLLVLGREKEGLPAEIIRILDYTIEIPQLGLIRSLNVHVSGAIALYEYRRQHPPPKKR